MFTTATAANYRQSEGLLVWYEQELSGDSNNFVKLTRHATKKYAYFNIHPDSAADIVNAKVALYTRNFAAWTLSGVIITQSSVTECMSEITCTETSAGSRDVNISVNEQDVKYVQSSAGFIANPAAYFTDANARDYEENVHPKTTSGLSSYSRKTNFHVSTDLSIRYRVEKSGSGYVYTRYAKKTFSYIGMKQAVAENCAKAKRAQYCRDYDFVSDTTNKTKIAHGANISLRHDAYNWSVHVQVNETDVKYSSSNVAPATLFATENARSYDGSDLLVLDSVVRSSRVPGATTQRATVTGECNIPGYTIANTTFEYRIGDNLTWNTAAVTWTAGTGETWLPVTDDTIYCRLTCASTESDTIIAQ